MLAEILGIIYKAVYWILVPTALMRAYMHYVRVTLRNPLGRFVCALTDWLILPLRRILKGRGRVDWASAAAACLLEFGLSAAYMTLLGNWKLFSSVTAVTGWLIGGVFGLTVTAVTLMMWLTIANALLSWVQTESTMGDVLDAITAPWLKPIRRILPMVGGFDLSPLALIVLLQIILVALAHAQQLVLMLAR